MNSKKIGRYEIRGELGRGGMATVYLAYDPGLEREVALKVLPTYFAHEPEFSARFAREAKTVAALEHNAIVSMYDYGEHGEWPYFVMQLMKGGSLKEKIEQGPLGLTEAVNILKRVGSALDRAHSRNLIHRDLKPGNILFDEDGDAYLTDFGIVKIAEGSDNFTQTGNTLGTAAYMSPEQARGVGEIDGRSDIYALGVILYEMLTGNVPYKSDTTLGQAMMHVMDPLPEILSVNPDLPPAADEIIKKAMAKEREERYATASELAAAVEAVAEGKSMAAVTPEVIATPPPPEPEPDTEPEPAVAPATDATPITQEKVLETATAVTPPPAKKGGIPTWAYAVAGLVVIVLIVVIVLSGGDEGGEEITDNSNNSEQVLAATNEPEPTDAPQPTDEPEPTDAPEPTDEPEPTPTDEPEPSPTSEINQLGNSEVPSRTENEFAIAYGDTLEGTVGENESVTYTFSGKSGELIDVVVTPRGDFDPVVEVLDVDGRSMSGLVDLFFDTEYIQALRLIDDGKYTIQISGFEGQTGSFDIFLQDFSNEANIASALYSSWSITAPDEEDSFYFYAQGGDQVRAIVQPYGDLDINLELYNFSTDELVDSVDIFGPDRAEDLFVSIPSSDAYYFLVSNSEGTLGDYEASFYGPTTTTFDMYSGNSMVGEFKDTDYLTHAYVGNTGETVNFFVEPSEEVDSLIQILDVDGNFIEEVDDSGVGEEEEISYAFTTDEEVIFVTVINLQGEQGFFILNMESENGPTNSAAITPPIANIPNQVVAAMRLTSDQMLSFGGMIDVALGSGFIECNEVVNTYDAVVSAPRFDVVGASQLIQYGYGEYRSAVEVFSSGAWDMAQNCRDFLANPSGGDIPFQQWGQLGRM